MNITFGERKLIKSNTLLNPVSSAPISSTSVSGVPISSSPVSSAPISSVPNQVDSKVDSIVSYKEYDSIIVGGKGGGGGGGKSKGKPPPHNDPNSSEARKKRHLQRLDDIMANTMIGTLFGLGTAKTIFSILSVFSTIGGIIATIWNIINLIIILMIIKIILQVIDAGLNASHGLIEGIRGVLQKIHDLNMTIPLSKIKIPDIPLHINTPDLKLGKIPISDPINKMHIPGFTIPDFNLPSIPGIHINHDFVIPTIPDINANVFAPVLGNPIKKLTHVNNQIPNNSSEVLKDIAKALFLNVGPFAVKMADIGRSIVK